MAAAIQCAWLHPWLTGFPLLQFAVFAPTFRQQAPELREALRRALAWLAEGWRLDVDPPGRVWVLPFFSPWLGARTVIRESGPDRWNIRIARPGLAVCAGREYHIRFLVRAKRTRTIMFGIWQDHAPWEGLGHCEDLAVSPRWQVVGRRFTATGSDPEGYFGFWLGGEPGTVDILISSIRALKPKESVG